MIVPFLINLGTQILQHIILFAQGVQSDILSQGLVAYIQGLSRIPSFLQNNILEYIQSTDSTEVIHTFTQNIVNISSSYLRIIGEYAMNIF